LVPSLAAAAAAAAHAQLVYRRTAQLSVLAIIGKTAKIHLVTNKADLVTNKADLVTKPVDLVTKGRDLVTAWSQTLYYTILHRYFI
jgi:hypothetical protein